MRRGGCRVASAGDFPGWLDGASTICANSTARQAASGGRWRVRRFDRNGISNYGNWNRRMWQFDSGMGPKVNMSLKIIYAFRPTAAGEAIVGAAVSGAEADAPI